MKKIVQLILLLLLFSSGFVRCSIYEQTDIEVVIPPQRQDSLIIHPWEPEQGDTILPPVGH